MSRRASLPGASELFRRTSSPALDEAIPHTPNRDGQHHSDGRTATGTRQTPASDGASAGAEVGGLRQVERAREVSARQKHDSKITVYLSGDELLRMEHARLNLRGKFGVPVDRGRLVREAVAIVLADLEQQGEASALVQRLREAEAGSDGAAG